MLMPAMFVIILRINQLSLLIVLISNFMCFVIFKGGLITFGEVLQMKMNLWVTLVHLQKYLLMYPVNK